MSPGESPFRVLSLIDEEPVPVAGGTLHWVPLRRRLGIRAFGTNAFQAVRAGDPVIEEHVESPGQEELYASRAATRRRAPATLPLRTCAAPSNSTRACVRAATEEQLAPLRDLEGWRALVG